MNDDQLLRYSRHILLPPLGIEGQEALLAAHVLIVGVGGLGCPAALYLAVSGVGTISLADADKVELSNLQRQILHRTHNIGTPKAESAGSALYEYNPTIRLHLLPQRLQDTPSNDGDLSITQAVSQADFILDCSDNFTTRYALNRACVALNKPLISGAAVGFDGQVMVFDRRQANSACYHCLFPEEGDVDEQACAVTGVFAPLTGTIGTLQAAETIKLIVGMGVSLHQRLLLMDALDMRIRTVGLSRDLNCKVCGNNAISP